MWDEAALEVRAARLAEALRVLEETLDWEALGRLYCEEGGEHFFPPEQREAIRASAAAFFEDLLRHLRPGGASHYVGAAVAELPLLCFEALVLERPVHWTLPEGPERELLAGAMARAGGPVPVAPGPPPWPVDHLWCVSVLTDPDAFPALHDELYGRDAASGGTGHGDAAAERREAERLVAEWLASLRPPATLSTTDEEAPFFRAACEARGWALALPGHGRLSGIVGDVVRHGTVT